MKQDDWKWSNNSSRSNLWKKAEKKTAHLASSPERIIQRGLPRDTSCPQGYPLVPLWQILCLKAIWLPAGGPGTIVCLPTKRCDFSNWQSLFKCLATSWQTPMLTAGRGTWGGWRGRGSVWCLRGRILPLHWFIFFPSPIFGVEGRQQHNWLFG